MRVSRVKPDYPLQSCFFFAGRCLSFRREIHAYSK
jgi:hypothetical protein